jgi:hypothetical protein
MDHERPAETPSQTVNAAPAQRGTPPPGRSRVLRALGLGLITGAADDDCSAIGTYASAGAKLGPAFLGRRPSPSP